MRGGRQPVKARADVGIVGTRDRDIRPPDDSVEDPRTGRDARGAPGAAPTRRARFPDHDRRAGADDQRRPPVRGRPRAAGVQRDGAPPAAARARRAGHKAMPRADSSGCRLPPRSSSSISTRSSSSGAAARWPRSLTTRSRIGACGSRSGTSPARDRGIERAAASSTRSCSTSTKARVPYARTQRIPCTARRRSHALSAFARRQVLAVWAEEPDRSYPERLRAAGFTVAVHQGGGRGGRTHVVYVGIRPEKSA